MSILLPYQPEGERIPSPSADPVLGGLTAMVRRQRPVMAACLVFAMVLVGAYTLWIPPAYEATSIVRIELEQVDLPQLVQQLSTENRISTEIELLRSRSAAVAVVDSLGLRIRLAAPRRHKILSFFSRLSVTPSVDSLTLRLRRSAPGTVTIDQGRSTPADTSLRPGQAATILGVTLAPTPAVLRETEVRLRVVPLEDAVRDFQSSLTVSRPARDADLIAVRIRSSDPDRAAASANLLAEHLISGRQGVKRERTRNTIRYLRQQVDTVRTRLRASEDALRDYRERAQAVDPAEQARTQVGRLAQLEADRAAVDAERQALEKLVLDLGRDSSASPEERAAPANRLMAFPTLFKNQATAALLAGRAQVEGERAALMLRRMPRDPDVQMLTLRLGEYDAQLRGIAETYLEGLRNQVIALNGVAGRFASALEHLPEKEVRVARLERQARMNQELYTLLQSRLNEAQVTQALDDQTVRIVDPAVAPSRPIRPRPLLNMVLSLVLGTMLGLVAALGLELTNHSVRSRTDARLAAGLPVVGAIPRAEHRPLVFLPGRARRGDRTRPAVRSRSGPTPPIVRTPGSAGARLASRLITRPECSAIYAESFHQLHASLPLIYRDRGLKVLVFTSPLPREGKTLSAINFALTGAARGLRVLLIDADLRCGVVNSVFGCPRTPGFAEILAGTAGLELAGTRLEIADGSLTLLPTGAPPKNPAHVFTSEHLREVLTSLSVDFDLVVVDSPPVNLLADAALLGSAADGVLLVVRVGHTDVEALRFAMEQLAAARAPVIGTLLNDIDVRRNGYDDDSYRYLIDAGRYREAQPG